MSTSSDNEAWNMVETLTASGLIMPPLGGVPPSSIRKLGHFSWASREFDVGAFHGGSVAAVAEDIAGQGAVFGFVYLSNSLKVLSTSPLGDVVVFWQHGFGSTYGGVEEDDIANANAVSSLLARQWAARPDTGIKSASVRWLAFQDFGRTGLIDLDALREGAPLDDAHEDMGEADTFEGANDLLRDVLTLCTDRLDTQQNVTARSPESRPAAAPSTSGIAAADSAASKEPQPAGEGPELTLLVPHLAEALRRLADDSHLVISVHGSIRYVQFATFRPNLRLETIGTRYLDDAGEAWSVDEVVWLAEHDWHDADDDGNLWRDWIPADETDAARAAVDALVNVHGVTSLDQVWFKSEDDNALAALEADAPGNDIEPARPIPPGGLQPPATPEQRTEINAALNALMAKDAEGVVDMPEGTTYLAIVDYVARNSVLELLAFDDGKIFRRHDGRWYIDPAWIRALKKAPAKSVVLLTSDQLERVCPKVDASTEGQPWEKFDTSTLEMYWPSYRPNDPDMFDADQLRPSATSTDRAGDSLAGRGGMAPPSEVVPVPPVPVPSPGAEPVGTLTRRFDGSSFDLELRLWTDGTVAATNWELADAGADDDVPSPMPVRFSWWATILFGLAGLAPTLDEVVGLAVGFANDIYPAWAPDALRGRVEVRLLVAEDSACPPELLAVLAADRNELVRAAVAEHPACPTELLAVLAADENRKVRRRVARHASCPGELLAILVRDEDRLVSRAATSNPHFPHDLLGTCARSTSADRRSTVALNPTCPVELLTVLAGDVHEQVRSKVAEHASCPAEILTVLSEDVHEQVRSGVARNPSCPVDLLLILDRDDSSKVREAAAQHPSYPVELLAVLAEDKNPHVRKSAALHPYCPVQLLTVLSRDGYAEVRAAVAGHASCPAEPLALLAQDEQCEVREVAAKHPACPPELLPALAADGEEWVRAGAAGHPNCPVELLAVLAEDVSACVREAAAEHPSCPTSLLTVLAVDDSVHVRKAARRNPGFVS